MPDVVHDAAGPCEPGYHRGSANWTTCRCGEVPISKSEIGPCWAGRKAFFGGEWKEPCPGLGIHVILSSPGAPEIELCEEHFQQVNSAGLVTMPYVDQDEARAREIVAEEMRKGTLG